MCVCHFRSVEGISLLGRMHKGNMILFVQSVHLYMEWLYEILGLDKSFPDDVSYA